MQEGRKWSSDVLGFLHLSEYGKKILIYIGL